MPRTVAPAARSARTKRNQFGGKCGERKTTFMGHRGLAVGDADRRRRAAGYRNPPAVPWNPISRRPARLQAGRSAAGQRASRARKAEARVLVENIWPPSPLVA